MMLLKDIKDWMNDNGYRLIFDKTIYKYRKFELLEKLKIYINSIDTYYNNLLKDIKKYYNCDFKDIKIIPIFIDLNNNLVFKILVNNNIVELYRFSKDNILK